MCMMCMAGGGRVGGLYLSAALWCMFGLLTKFNFLSLPLSLSLLLFPSRLPHTPHTHTSHMQAVAVARHMGEFPDDGLLSSLYNVLSFDAFDPDTLALLSTVFTRNGIPLTERDIVAVFEVPRLPVDRRHNSKIDRTAVAEWASAALAGGSLGKL